MREETILITGASGFVATHIVDSFLQAGYSVRGTVRSQQTAERVKSTFPDSRLSFVIVPDIAVPGAFDEAVKNVTGVIHTASPFQMQVEDNVHDLLEPTINGASSLLQSITKHGSQVRRLVLTSSFAAMIDLSKGPRPDHVYTEADWNPITYEQAASKECPGVAAYTAAKTLAERAAWDLVKQQKVGFDVVSICPPMIYGPSKNATAKLANLNTSSADIYRLMSPTSKTSDPVPDTLIWSWVDVRDVATAHLRAYQVPEASGQRFFVCSSNFSYQQIADILREKVPGIKERVPLGKPGSGFGGVELYGIDTSRSQKVLGIQYRRLEECVTDMAGAFLELEKEN